MSIDDVAYWQNGGNLPPAATIGPNMQPLRPTPAPPAPPREVRVRLHTTRESLTSLARVNDLCLGTISQIAFADHLHRPKQDPGRTVHIEMDAWYIENYPLGFCTGMLCHGFAVHHMGDYMLKQRGDNSLLTEARYTSGAMQGTAFGVAAPQVRPSTAGQADHVFAAHTDAGRHEVYLETVVDVAIAMLAKVRARSRIAW